MIGAKVSTSGGRAKTSISIGSMLLPRYRLVGQVIIEPSGEAVLDRLSTAGIGHLSKLAVVEAADAADLVTRQRRLWPEASVWRGRSPM